MNLADCPLLKPHVGKPAILDANLLLLHWCAAFNRDLIRSFKRLNSFQTEDIELLSETLKAFSVGRTTPHVLTEVSNLANSLHSGAKEDWSQYFSCQIQVIPEEWVPAREVAANSLMWLGLTDVVLAELASTHVILTMDWPLTNCLESQGLGVINFTRLRGTWME
jgi:hypothetical protein